MQPLLSLDRFVITKALVGNPQVGREEGGVRQMRLMVTVRVPIDEGNEMVKSGTLGENLQTILEDIKPEAAYLSVIEGARGGYFVVNVDDSSQIPAVVEPFFLLAGATVQMQPVLTPEDFGRSSIDQVAQKYG